MTSKFGSFGALVTMVGVLAACTAIHPPEPYTPSRAGVVPGETVTVSGNQNVYGIAQEHGVSMRDIIVLNNLQQPFALKDGQRLVLPFRANGAAGAGVTTASAPTPQFDTITTAPIGGVQQENLPSVETHPLPPPPPANVPPLTKKEIFGAAPPVATAPVAPAVAPVAALNKPAVPSKKVETTLAAASAAASAASGEDSAADAPTMVWPVQGAVLSSFGAKGAGINNDGVNIGAPKGAPVVAASNGIVVYAGNEMKGFGNLVLIRHQGGWVTAYAYLDRVLVTKDAVVAQGDMIGTVGKTGNIASPQLHFEVRHAGKAVDPNGVVKQ